MADNRSREDKLRSVAHWLGFGLVVNPDGYDGHRPTYVVEGSEVERFLDGRSAP